MTLGLIESVEIIELMENYIERVRPRLEIRSKLDIGYEISGQSVILQEIRPLWNNPKEIQRLAYAKATYVKNKSIWKIFWMRANLKWHSYEPQPTVKLLYDFLKIVNEDKYACFKG